MSNSAAQESPSSNCEISIPNARKAVKRQPRKNNEDRFQRPSSRDSGGTQTRDPQFRRLLLYSAELPNHLVSDCKFTHFSLITEIISDYSTASAPKN